MDPAESSEMPVWAIVLIPIAFFVVFPLFWCFVLWINSHVSGWQRLAARYRSGEEPKGKRWEGIQGRVGVVAYRGALACITNENGLFLQPAWIFRFGHPQLFLPWSDLHRVRRVQWLWLSMVSAKIGDPAIGSLALEAKIFEGSEAGNRLLLSPS